MSIHSNNCESLPIELHVQPKFDGVKHGFFSFIGPVTYFELRNKSYSCTYYCDGILASLIFSMICGRRIQRVSFDYSSIAKTFLTDCEQSRRRVLCIGGTESDSSKFSAHLMREYPELSFECLSGYPNGGFNDLTLPKISLQSIDFDVVLLALGTPLQERVGKHLLDNGFAGTIITAGAFISQTARAGGRFYPKMVNILHIRFVWRLIFEPHTRPRFKYVFMFPIAFAIDLLKRRVAVRPS